MDADSGVSAVYVEDNDEWEMRNCNAKYPQPDESIRISDHFSQKEILIFSTVLLFHFPSCPFVVFQSVIEQFSALTLHRELI